MQLRPFIASCDDEPAQLKKQGLLNVKGSPKQETLSTYENRSVPRYKSIPHRFVLEAIADRAPTTRAMFGALAVYVGDKIVFILRDHAKDRAANGVWVAVLPEHEAVWVRSFRARGEFTSWAKTYRVGFYSQATLTTSRRCLYVPASWYWPEISGSAKFRHGSAKAQVKNAVCGSDLLD